MTACPFCGESPQAITQNAATGAPLYECENDHYWADPVDNDGNTDDGNPDGSPLANIPGLAPHEIQPDLGLAEPDRNRDLTHGLGG